ncbi:MAG: YdeI/OmpD-associated family protein [Rhodothermales bacterium]
MDRFKAELQIIDGNPFVFVPEGILNELFARAGKSKGPIPVRGEVNGEVFLQTLVKYKGEWRLYINMKMLPDSPRRIGEVISLSIKYDPDDRRIEPHPKLVLALQENEEAQRVFDSQPAYMKKEIVRYISLLKNEESVDRNVKRAISFLLGSARFVGRDSPVKKG